MSQAGEPIEILSDEDWADLTGTDVKSVRAPFKSKLGLCLALWHHGTIRDPQTGRATALLHPLAVEMGYQGRAIAITAAMHDPLNAPAFDRVTNGKSKRTYAISLIALPETWLKRMQEIEPESFIDPEAEAQKMADLMSLVQTPAVEPEPTPEPEPDGLELEIELPEYVPPPEPLPTPSPYLEVAPQVAMALLTQVVEIISAGSPEAMDARVKALTADVGELADKLARRLQENDALRRKVRELGDEINAVKYERDGLRTRLRLTEHNLQTALKSDVMTQVNERVMRELEKVMRVVPSPSRKDAD